MGVNDPSTFLGHELCLRMNKEPHMHEPKSDTWLRGLRRKGEPVHRPRTLRSKDNSGIL